MQLFQKIFLQVDGKTAFAFWLKYPSPRCLNEVGVDQLADFLYKKSNRNQSTENAFSLPPSTKEQPLPHPAFDSLSAPNQLR